jgi:hypothetical protein
MVQFLSMKQTVAIHASSHVLDTPVFLAPASSHVIFIPASGLLATSHAIYSRVATIRAGLHARGIHAMRLHAIISHVMDTRAPHLHAANHAMDTRAAPTIPVWKHAHSPVEVRATPARVWDGRVMQHLASLPAVRATLPVTILPAPLPANTPVILPVSTRAKALNVYQCRDQ